MMNFAFGFQKAKYGQIMTLQNRTNIYREQKFCYRKIENPRTIFQPVSKFLREIGLCMKIEICTIFLEDRGVLKNVPIFFQKLI